MTEKNEKQAEREAFEGAVRAITDPARIEEVLMREDGEHYDQWPTTMAWEVWQARAALAQQPQGKAPTTDDTFIRAYEVGAHVYKARFEAEKAIARGEGSRWEPLYRKNHPKPQAAPVAQGLTDEEVYGVLRSYGVDRKDSDNIAHDLRLAQAAPSASKDASAPVFPPYSGTELKAAMCFETPPCAGVAKPITGKEQA